MRSIRQICNPAETLNRRSWLRRRLSELDALPSFGRFVLGLFEIVTVPKPEAGRHAGTPQFGFGFTRRCSSL